MANRDGNNGLSRVGGAPQPPAVRARMCKVSPCGRGNHSKPDRGENVGLSAVGGATYLLNDESPTLRVNPAWAGQT